jgi:peroxiredoxin
MVTKVGDRAPDFVLPNLAGERHRLSDHRGRSVAIFMWGSW